MPGHRIGTREQWQAAWDEAAHASLQVSRHFPRSSF